MINIELLSLGGAREIGANSYFVRFGSTGVLIDSGLHPELTGWDAFPKIDLLAPGELDALIITHAHNDHIGALPYILQSQPQAKVYATRETIDLAYIMLANTASLFPKQHPQSVLDALPNYQEEKLAEVIDSIQPVPFGKPFMIGDDLRVTFTISGHILGTAGLLFEYQGKRLFHTADIKMHNQHITAGAALPEGNVDILITETTNGLPDEYLMHTRAQEYERFCATTAEVLHSGGSVLIPSFALGKMQEMLVMMWDAMRAGKLPYVPIYTGGMGRRISDVYDAHRLSRSRCDTETIIADIPQEDIPRRDGLFGGRYFKQPSIVLAASGMMQEGTASYLLAQRWLRHEHFAICFIGYTDPRTPGYAVQHAVRGKRLKFGSMKRDVPVRCRIERFRFSAHAKQDELLEVIRRLAPKSVVMTHGDMAAMNAFGAVVSERHPHILVTAPEIGKWYTLSE